MCQDCVRLYEQLKQNESEMFGLKRTITNLRGQLRHERREKAKLIKEKKETQKPFLRKGQKRSRFGRN